MLLLLTCILVGVVIAQDSTIVPEAFGASVVEASLNRIHVHNFMVFWLKIAILILKKQNLTDAKVQLMLNR